MGLVLYLFVLLPLIPIVLIVAGRRLVQWLLARAVPARSSAAPSTRSLQAAIAAILAVVATPPLFGPLVEDRVGWTDEDGNGFQDDFEAGAYDWIEVVGPWYLGIWSVLVVAGLVALVLTSRHRPGRRSRTAADATTDATTDADPVGELR